MTWSFQDVNYRVFNRNPLVSTDIELRFHPIVRIATQKQDIALFQDAVRGQFPLYRQNNVRNVAMEPNGNFRVEDEVEHVFTDLNNADSIVLNQTSLRASSRDHQSRERLIAQFELGAKSLEQVFDGFSGHRLGLRYVNIIDKAKISEETTEELNWEDLISAEFLTTPHEIADTANTNFMMELRSNLNDREGELALRYGLTQNQEGMPDHFRFDIDRYLSQPEGIELQAVLDHLDSFARDIYSLFNTVVGEKLTKWMEH